MPANISNFLHSFKGDLAKPSRFDVSIPVPYTLSPYISSTRNMNMRCEATELPSRTFATAEKKIGSVPIQKYAYQSTYNDLPMTFIVSSDMTEKLFFDAWMELINPVSNFNFTYKSNYVSDISINQYDLSNNLTYRALLVDAFPIAVNQLDLDWSNDMYHKLTVVFAYTYWTNTTPGSIGNSVSSRALSGLNNILTNF